MPLPAQTGARTPGTDSNVMIAPAESSTATNVVQASNTVAGATAKPIMPAGIAGPVHVGQTDIHAGGEKTTGATGGHNAGGLGFGKTLVAVLVSFVLPVTVVVVLPVSIFAIMFYAAHRRNKLLHDNLRAMIDKGMPITPELMQSLKGRPSGVPMSSSRISRTRLLLPALFMSGVGSALMINEHRFSGPGLIVLFIGIAFLIVWLVERPDRNNVQSPKQ